MESHAVNGCFSVFELNTEQQDLWCPRKFVSRLIVNGLKLWPSEGLFDLGSEYVLDGGRQRTTKASSKNNAKFDAGS